MGEAIAGLLAGIGIMAIVVFANLVADARDCRIETGKVCVLRHVPTDEPRP